MIKRDGPGCQVELKIAEGDREAAGKLKRTGNPTDLFFRSSKKSTIV
jgi:hypothetical protein